MCNWKNIVSPLLPLLCTDRKQSGEDNRQTSANLCSKRTDKHQARFQVLEATATPILDTRRILSSHRCQFSQSYLLTQSTENPLHCTPIFQLCRLLSFSFLRHSWSSFKYCIALYCIVFVIEPISKHNINMEWKKIYFNFQ